MKIPLTLSVFLLPLYLIAQPFTPAEIARWQVQAKRVTIQRDQWGIPHLYGKTDADVVFGLLYAQCEDDFMRVEMNYIDKLGRKAEVRGEAELYNDLLVRMLIDTTEAKEDYRRAPTWLKKLLQAQADGINYYLHTHPQVKPALLTRFEPWFPLLWTDGSIGAINTAELGADDLRKFYAGEDSDTDSRRLPDISAEESASASNAFAFAPKMTASGNAILLINPHVSFYFRPEVHVHSEEGLHAYGAVTWGQFFVYQGFNEWLGWMHTSTYTDVADLYAEKVRQQDGKWQYEYEGKWLPIREKKISLHYTDKGKKTQQTFTAYYTHHGAVMGRKDGRWLTVRASNRDMNSLIQSWQRTKAKTFAAFKRTMNLRANATNNTMYADNEGNIAYWHGNFMPKRDTRFDWTKPVDGSIAATEWQGQHKLEELVQYHNPANGWLQNCNATPFTAAGEASGLRPENYAPYIAPDAQNFRGINAVKVLNRAGAAYTLDKAINIAYDPHLTAFEVLVPGLLRAFEASQNDALKTRLAAAIAELRAWDFKASEQSIANTLAVEWGERVLATIQKLKIQDDERADFVRKAHYFAQKATESQLLTPLAEVMESLEKRFGTWRVAWGEINRFQRIANTLDPRFDDAQESLPIKYTTAVWGMLPAYVSRYYNTQKRYGVYGNSFVCAVEFDKKRLRAKSLLVGGVSGDAASPHFKDQAAMYVTGKFKEISFYKEEVLANTKRRYHPGE